MKRIALVLVMAVMFALPVPVFANGNVTVNMAYIGPGGGAVEGDFAGFKILRDGVLVQTLSTPIPTAQWIDNNLPDPPEEGYTYTVIAFDTEGIDGPSGTGTAEWKTYPGPLQGSVTVGITVNVVINPTPQ